MSTVPNKERLRAWVDSLRSGKYIQILERLALNEECMCATGIACDIFVKDNPDAATWVDVCTDLEARENILALESSDFYGLVLRDNFVGGVHHVRNAPYMVQAYFGLAGSTVLSHVGPDQDVVEGYFDKLWRMNDDGRSFEEIADTIESDFNL